MVLILQICISSYIVWLDGLYVLGLATYEAYNSPTVALIELKFETVIDLFMKNDPEKL